MKWIAGTERLPKDESKKYFIRWKHRLTKDDEWETLFATPSAMIDPKYWKLEWLESESEHIEQPSDFKELLKRCLPYISDLNADNYNDMDAGVFEDTELRNLIAELRSIKF